MAEFDVVLVGDFRFPGGTSVATAHEIRALAAADYKIGLVQSNAPVLKQKRGIHPQIRKCLDSGMARLVEKDASTVRAPLGIFHNPLAFTEPVRATPPLHFDHSLMVAHQGPRDVNGIPYYDSERVQLICDEASGAKTLWAPISPPVRRGLEAEKSDIRIHGEDWHNTFFIEDWAASRQKPLKPIPVLGRHGRADRDKWPATKSDILTVYPPDPSVEVRLLGVGDFLSNTVGAFPENWTTFKFGQVDPAAFLKTIDFFVYYHHPHWVEAFGRTIAEALASGSVAVLPPHFAETFNGAAIYAPADEAVEQAKALHGDWRRYRKQSEIGQHFVKKNFGPERHVGFVKRLGAEARSRPGRGFRPKRIIGAKVNAMNKSIALQDLEGGKLIGGADGRHDYDVITAADMRASDDRALRIAHEIRIQSHVGYRSGVLHLPSKAVKHQFIRGEIAACVREGLADRIDPEATVKTRLLVLHGWDRIFDVLPPSFPTIEAETVVVVADKGAADAERLQETHRLLSLVFRKPPLWAPVSQRIRNGLVSTWPEIPLDPDNWEMALSQIPWKERVSRPDRPVVAIASISNVSGEALVNQLSTGFYVRALQEDANPDRPYHSAVEFFSTTEISATKLIDRADFIIVPEEKNRIVPPPALLADAMARGKIPILPPRLAKEFGHGAVSVEPSKMMETMAGIWTSGRMADMSHDAARNARVRFPEELHRDRLHRLAGPVLSAPHIVGTAKPRIAFVSSNGVGLGHLTRLLSIARRLPNSVDAFFITMSQAFGVVEQFGFNAEYVPFHSQCETSANKDWNDWFRQHFETLLDQYDVSGVVFDGGAPYAGLVSAIAPRPDLFSVWVRRGMWRLTQMNEPLIKRQKFFDLIIEPRDIADVRDTGLTSNERGKVALVDPIRLIEDEELLSREEAAAALGLDPSRPAVLIQLGSGATRDIASLNNDIAEACAQFPNLQKVIVEWAIGVTNVDGWPGVKVLRGYPMSQYLRAFDFTIAAAGYNSFNEIISFGLPAIFVANDAPMMDDQGGRAGFAEEQGAAFSVSEYRIAAELPGLVNTMLDPRIREVLSVNCVRIARDNGASAAAKLIIGLAGVEGEPIVPTLAPYQLATLLPTAVARTANKPKQRLAAKRNLAVKKTSSPAKKPRAAARTRKSSASHVSA